MKYDFDKDLELSKKYEVKFADWLKSKGVPGVRLAPNYVFEDYDVESEYSTYEVKYDRWMSETGNFCLETVSCNEKNSLGWFFKTKADYVVVFYNETEFVHIKMKDLSDAWFDHPELWTMKRITNNNWTTIVWLADCKTIPNLNTGSIQ